MKYLVYTDGASNQVEKCVGCAYFIMADKTYITSGSVKVQGMTNPTQAETIAVGLASGSLIKDIKFEDGDSVEFYIDCTSTISFCETYARNKRPIRTKNERVTLAINVLRKLVESVDVSFYHVKGHTNTMNPNSYVDKLAKLAIRKQ